MEVCFDIEGNGLRHEFTDFYCLHARNIDTGEEFTFSDQDIKCDVLPLLYIPDFIASTTKVIGHNIVSYDLPILKDWFDMDAYSGTVIDTLIWSKTLFPDRQLPKRCPTSIESPVTGRKKRVGPHSLHAWGYRVGKHKPIIHDWTVFTPAMLARCKEDVDITIKTYASLLKEAGLDNHDTN